MSTIPVIALATKINAPYLRKVLNKLRDAELISTQQGTGGGISLTRSPVELTMLDIVGAVDSLKRIESCPLGVPGHNKLCPLHSEIDRTLARMYELLESKTIAELVAQKTSEVGRCGFPREEEVYQL